MRDGTAAGIDLHVMGGPKTADPGELVLVELGGKKAFVQGRQLFVQSVALVNLRNRRSDRRDADVEVAGNGRDPAGIGNSPDDKRVGAGVVHADDITLSGAGIVTVRPLGSIRAGT